MIIIINEWKKKMLHVLTALVLIIAFAFSMPVIAGKAYEKIPVFNTWFEDEQPTGNPMRVENKTDTKFDQAVEQFVIKLQDFYYEEK